MVKEQILSMLKNDIIPVISSGAMSDRDRVWIRDGKVIWSTGENSSLSAVNVNELAAVSIDNTAESPDKLDRLAALVMKQYTGIKVLILNRSHYPKTISMTGETLKPYVDDIAQIIGIDIRNLPISDTGRILKQFKNRSAVTIAGEGILCSGSSVDDAAAAAVIADKAANIHIRGSYIAKLKFIGAAESALMRFIYLRKYSKQAALAGRE